MCSDAHSITLSEVMYTEAHAVSTSCLSGVNHIVVISTIALYALTDSKPYTCT